MTSPLLTLFSVITRIVCIGFLVVAGFTIPQAWQLNDSEYHMGGDNGRTVYVPIEICDKQSISVDGSAIIFPGNMNGCHTLEYLINACVASLIFACAAMLLFVLFDTLARCNKGPVAHSSVLGMSLFLTFILVQSAACCYALYKECKYWEDYFLAQYKALGSNQVDEVKTYGDKLYFFVACMLALGTALLLLIDTLLSFCTGDDRRKPASTTPAQPTPAQPAPSEAAPTEMNKSTDEESVPQECAAEGHDDPKKWTDY